MHGLTMNTFSVLLSLTPLALAVQSGTELPSLPTVPASVFLEEAYGDALPTAATGALATSLASALYSYEMAMTTNAAFISADEAMLEAIATLTNSEEIGDALMSVPILNPAFTVQSWFTHDVPASAQTAIVDVINELHAVETSVLNAGAAAATTVASITSSATLSTSTSKSTGSSSGASTSATTSATTSVSAGGAAGAQVTQMAAVGLAAAFAAGAAVLY